MSFPGKTKKARESAVVPVELPEQPVFTETPSGEPVQDTLPNLFPVSPVVSDTFSVETGLTAPFPVFLPDSLASEPLLPYSDSLFTSPLFTDSLAGADTLFVSLPDSLPADSLTDSGPKYDSLGRRDYGKSYLDDVIHGENRDSVVYDVRTGLIRGYNEGKVTYQEMSLEADYMLMGMDDKLIYAHGVPDTAGLTSRPIFTDQGKEYTMDTIVYNLNTGKAKIKGVWTTEGDGILRGRVIKKMPDNSANIRHGVYSTCDADHPHFYIEMSKAKVIPGEKAVFGYTYLVMEDVPLPFLMLPFGFFPLNNEKASGFIIPSFGEEFSRGFFIRDGGYYFVPNDYMDFTFLGGIYTKGSWEASVNTRYKVRYKYNGGINLQYYNNKFGDKASGDYSDEKTYKIQWTHTQDPKFKPGSTFSASINFSSSQANRYNATTINDYTTNQTSSSVSYSKNWAGTPFSLGLGLSHTQVNTSQTYSFTFPSLSFSMNKVSPFKFKNRKPGPERWYEKLSLSYRGNGTNSVNSVHEDDLFKKPMFDQMNTEMSHSIPVNANFTLFNYININPNFTYNAYWNTKKFEQHWDALAGPNGAVVTDTVKTFNRVYQYSTSISASTTIYGMYDNFKPTSKIQAVRHTLTPNVSFSYAPDFGSEKYGFYKPVQTNKDGDIAMYSPYSRKMPRGKSSSMTFSLNQTLEAKVLSDKDSTGVKKIKIIDEFSFSLGYNFAATDGFKWSRKMPVRLRSSLIPGININFNTQFGLYEVDKEARREIPTLLWSNGKAPRLETLSTSFSWSKSFGKGAPNAMNSGTNLVDPYYNANDPFDPQNMLQDPRNISNTEDEYTPDINAYRNLLSSQYYDFSVPLNINFSYTINYRNTGWSKDITQTANFGGSVNLTPKWGVSVQSGYDFQRKDLSHTSLNLTRDLHCWQMNFNWIPFGGLKGWFFHISVKSNILRDLKYEKRGSRFDELNYRK